MKRSRVLVVSAALLFVLAAIVVGLVVVRPTAVVTAPDGVAIECVGVGTSDACEQWASTVLADGPGIHVFDPDDLARVRLTTPVLGMGECRATYYIGREPDDPAASEPIACPTD